MKHHHFSLQTMNARLLFSLLTLAVTPTFAATHAVLPGNSIQAKIDIAVAGDIVAIFGGTYSEHLSINKAIRLVEVSGQEVVLTGDITYTGVIDAPPLEGFTVGSAGRGITLTDTTGMVLRDLVGLTGNGVTANGASTLKIVDCDLTDITTGGTSTLQLWDSQINNLTAGGTTAEIWNSTVRASINQTAGSLHTTAISVGGNFTTQNAALKTVAFRTTVTGDATWKSEKCWFGYGKVRSFNPRGSNDKVVFVGSEIDRLGSRENGIAMSGSNNQFLICNSVIKGTISHGNTKKTNIEVAGNGHVVRIFNNYLDKSHTGTTENGFGHGHANILAGGDVTDLVIANNICKNTEGYTVDFIVDAPFGATVMNNHAIDGDYQNVSGGVVASNTTTGDPIFIDDDPRTLDPTSPLINAGTIDPRYNDRDGTRNDIGPSGGAWFDPDGWTTENPVVISFAISPDQVLEGVDTEIILSEGQAVSAP